MPDVLDTLDDAVAKIEAEERAKKAAKLIEAARIRALMDRDPNRAFFTNLAVVLEPRAEPACETMATDGKYMFFNPEFTLSKSPDEIHGIAIGHEPAHCWLKHFSRILPHWNKRKANVAGDLEINGAILEAGFTLPPDALVPGRGPYKAFPVGLSIEQYYAMLPDEEDGGGGDPGDGPGKPGKGYGNDPGGCGGVIMAPDPATAAQLDADWSGKIAGAAQDAARRGKLSGSLQRLIDRILKPKVSGGEILRDYLLRAARDEQTWARPHRRYLATGIYLPSRTGVMLGELVMTIDLSGSMGEKQLAVIAGIVQDVLEMYPAKLWVMYHDVDVQRVQEWNPGDGPLELASPGGGGTSHCPVFQEIIDRGLEPAVILCCTDLQTSFPDDPGIPTIWLATEETAIEPPFGRKIVIGE